MRYVVESRERTWWADPVQARKIIVSPAAFRAALAGLANNPNAPSLALFTSQANEDAQRYAQMQVNAMQAQLLNVAGTQERFGTGGLGHFNARLYHHTLGQLAGLPVLTSQHLPAGMIGAFIGDEPNR